MLNTTHRKNFVLLNSLQRLVVWLFLTFFICLHNQLMSRHSIIRVKTKVARLVNLKLVFTD